MFIVKLCKHFQSRLVKFINTCVLSISFPYWVQAVQAIQASISSMSPTSRSRMSASSLHFRGVWSVHSKELGCYVATWFRLTRTYPIRTQVRLHLCTTSGFSFISQFCWNFCQIPVDAALLCGNWGRTSWKGVGKHVNDKSVRILLLGHQKQQKPTLTPTLPKHAKAQKIWRNSNWLLKSV